MSDHVVTGQKDKRHQVNQIQGQPSLTWVPAPYQPGMMFYQGMVPQPVANGAGARGNSTAIPPNNYNGNPPVFIMGPGGPFLAPQTYFCPPQMMSQQSQHQHQEPGFTGLPKPSSLPRNGPRAAPNQAPFEATTTPTLQPPSHLYNGPPVSALVPKNPRNRKHERISAASVDIVEVPSPKQAKVGDSASSIPPTPDDHTSEPSRTPLLSIAASNNPSDNNAQPTPSLHEASLLLGLRNERSPDELKKLNAEKSYDVNSQNNDEPQDVNSQKNDEPQPQPPEPAPCVPIGVPRVYPRRLALANDHVKLNALHCFLRKELLEIFVVEPNTGKKIKFRHAPSSSAGRVGFRCVYCAAARSSDPNAKVDESEAPMAVFYPKSVPEIYRLVTSWQRCHVRKCNNLPPNIREEWQRLRHDKARGKTAYWEESALSIGLRTTETKAGGIHFDLNVLPLKEDDGDEFTQEEGPSHSGENVADRTGDSTLASY